ncbi:unnamed protein product [Caenorhabditis sp. 36 PRJEB53466]|nr:unnamed protein product [Caenorhabditis sp. 36 PRJEB53466]
MSNNLRDLLSRNDYLPPLTDRELNIIGFPTPFVRRAPNNGIGVYRTNFQRANEAIRLEDAAFNRSRNFNERAQQAAVDAELDRIGYRIPERQAFLRTLNDLRAAGSEDESEDEEWLTEWNEGMRQIEREIEEGVYDYNISDSRPRNLPNEESREPSPQIEQTHASRLKTAQVTRTSLSDQVIPTVTEPPENTHTKKQRRHPRKCKKVRIESRYPKRRRTEMPFFQSMNSKKASQKLAKQNSTKRGPERTKKQTIKNDLHMTQSNSKARVATKQTRRMTTSSLKVKKRSSEQSAEDSISPKRPRECAKLAKSKITKSKSFWS